MILLDLFSGYGGFHLGLKQAGFSFEKAYYSEIDKHAIANYRYNYEKAEYIGAVENVLTSGIERPDIITFGSPCQDFSVAGKRNGLSGKRSCLIEYALAAISHFRPSVYIWENVKGMSSSRGGADFIAIFSEFAKIGGYELSGQLIDTIRYLPQHRERYYIVGIITDRCSGQVLPIGQDESDFGKQSIYGQILSKAEVCSTITDFGKMRGDGCFIIQNPHGFNQGGKKEVAPSISKSSFENNNFVADCSRKNDTRVFNEAAPTLKENTYRHTSINKLRRFTEIELERLQGLPDDWTKFGNYNGEIKEISATQRYKMIGNGVTVKVVEEVGKAILKNIKI